MRNAVYPPLLPTLHSPTDAEALGFGPRRLTHRELGAVSASLYPRLRGAQRVAVWAAAELETCVGIVGALAAGVPVVPVNPRLGSRELHHVVSDAAPDLVLAARGAELPVELSGVARCDVDLRPGDGVVLS
ncbi:MAG: AMP-binding protein, partial [Actinomycetes bacterium]